MGDVVFIQTKGRQRWKAAEGLGRVALHVHNNDVDGQLDNVQEFVSGAFIPIENR